MSVNDGNNIIRNNIGLDNNNIYANCSVSFIISLVHLSRIETDTNKLQGDKLRFVLDNSELASNIESGNRL